MVSPLHSEEPEEMSDTDEGEILVAQQAGVSTAISQKKLFRASNPAADDYFQAVAISGDTVVVGAPFEDSNTKGVNGTQSNNKGTHSGAAYVYVRSGGGWVQQAYLKASNSGKNDQFGFSVAISGNTIVIGAFGEDSKSTGVNSTQTDETNANAGAAYVFTRTGTTWTQQAYLKSSTAAKGGLFGYSVAISGDSLIVGAVGESGTATGTGTSTTTLAQAGAAYVFTRSGTTWSAQGSLKASNPGENDLFGISVGISGNTSVVGARHESSDSTGVNGAQDDDTKIGSGAAYVFTRSSSTWTQQAYLKASNTDKDDFFGHSVAVSGDTIAVGAYQESSKARGVNKNQSDDSMAKSGAAYVFQRSGTKWRQQAYLKASNTGAGDGFGCSVAVSGDSVLVGAFGEDSNARGVQGNQANNSGLDSGAAYLFTRSAGKWSQKNYLKASNTGKNDKFGFSSAIDDGVAVVSAPGEAKNAGAAYLFEANSSPSPEIAIEYPTGTSLSNGTASVDMGTFKLGEVGDTLKKTFTIRNTGSADLTGLTVDKAGAGATFFTVSAISAPVVPGGNTTFTVTFDASGTASEARSASFTVKSNDLDESEFKIALTGQALSTTADGDGDDLNDWAESQYKTLGLDWQVKNAVLVTALKNFTGDQAKALNVSAPLLTKNAVTGKFTLTLGVEKSTDLGTFTAFPMSDATTSFTDGKLQFEFSSPENASFYRVQVK